MNITDNTQRAKRIGPLTIFKKYKSLDALTALGDEVKGAIQQGLADPKFGLELDHGRAMLRIDLEVVIDPASMPTKDSYQFSAPGLQPKEESVS